MKKTGLIGGTFDPIHYGHINLALCALERFDLDKVLFMPTDDPYYKSKSNVSSFTDRFNMTELALRDHEALFASDFERVHDTDGYTVNTLNSYREEFPDEELFFIIGGDSLFSMEKWKEVEKIFDMATILVSKRKDEAKGASGSLSLSQDGEGPSKSNEAELTYKDEASNHESQSTADQLDAELDAKIEQLKAKFDADIRNIFAPRFDVSSSELREKVKNGEAIGGLVPEAVEQYIKDHGLYI